MQLSAIYCPLMIVVIAWPVAKSELSASTQNELVSSGNMRIGTEVTRVWIWSKAVFSISVQCQMELFRVRSNSGWAKCENPSMNRW